MLIESISWQRRKLSEICVCVCVCIHIYIYIYIICWTVVSVCDVIHRRGVARKWTRNDYCWQQQVTQCNCTAVQGTHCCTHITVSYSYALVLFCSHGNSGYANAQHDLILYVHCLSCWTLNLGFKRLTCVCVCVCVLYTSSVEQVCDGRDRRRAIRHDSVYLFHA
jgi:hypothetical protein